MNAPKGPAEVLRNAPERTRPCHATSPCLANTRRFLHLFSLPAAIQVAARVLHSSGGFPPCASMNCILREKTGAQPCGRPQTTELLDDLGDHAGADGTATFADREAQ